MDLKISTKWNAHPLHLIEKPAISHTNFWDYVNSWKSLWKFWNGLLCRNKSDPSPLLNVAVYWRSSNTEACAKKLSQILANNIDNEGRVIGLRICVRYWWLRACIACFCFTYTVNSWSNFLIIFSTSWIYTIYLIKTKLSKPLNSLTY